MDAAVVVGASATAVVLGSDSSSPMLLGRGAAVQSVDKVDKRNAVKSDEDSRGISIADKEDVTNNDGVVADGGVSNGGSGNDNLGAASAASLNAPRELKSDNQLDEQLDVTSNASVATSGSRTKKLGGEVDPSPPTIPLPVVTCEAVYDDVAMMSLTRVSSPATNRNSPQPAHGTPALSLVSFSPSSDNPEAAGASRHLAVSVESGQPASDWTSGRAGQVHPSQQLQQQLARPLHQSRKRRSSGDSYDGVSVKSNHSGEHIGTAMTSSAGVGGSSNCNEPMKDEDDDNDDDDDDDVKLQSSGIDPDRLKAFNLFVRLFVDENLDRIVPISKQPKEKIQAILEACDRQFPEFHDRARKRIRTYLKSCRRMRRCKEGNGVELLRPTPPHLTSAIAETILAQACENESNNAKRMRMGLEPLPAISVATVRSTSPSPPGPLQQSASIASRSAGESPSTLYPVPDQPSSRIVTPPSRPTSISSGTSLTGLSGVVGAATASAIAAGASFPKQERISPAAAATVAMVTRMAPDDVALALTSSSSLVAGRQHQAHLQQSQQLMALTTPGGYDVQAAAAMLFGVQQPLIPHSLNGSVGGYGVAMNQRTTIGASATVGSGFNIIGTLSTTSVGARTAPLQTSSTHQVQNGPTDLSVKKPTSVTSAYQPSVASAASAAGSTASVPLTSVVAACGGGGGNGGGAAGGNGVSRNQLTVAEIETVKQLIAGYRESAAFLYRSADELEVLLQHN